MSYTIKGENLPIEVGKMLAEAFHQKGKDNVLKESFGITFK